MHPHFDLVYIYTYIYIISLLCMHYLSHVHPYEPINLLGKDISYNQKSVYTQSCVQSRNPKIAKHHIGVVACGSSGEISDVRLALPLGLVILKEPTLQFHSTSLSSLVRLQVH